MQLFMKIPGSTTKILIILNKETKDMIISKSIDAFDLLIKVAIEIIENEASNKKADFLLFCMLYNLLCYGIWFQLK